MKKIRIILAGVGQRGCWGVAAIRACPDFELVGLVDQSPGKLDFIVQDKQLGPIKRFSNLPEALQGVDCDAVAVFTHDAAHADLVVPALKAGKHVFVEKPLDVKEEKLQAIIDADRHAGGRTFVGFNLRYAPVYQTVHRLIQEGAVGKVLTIQADEFYDGGRTYFRRWHRLRSVGGGLWITKACHDFDLLYWMAGANPVSVYASASLDHYRPRSDAAMHCRDCDLNKTCPDRYEKLISPTSRPGKLNAITEKETGQKPDLCLFNSSKETFDHGVATVTFANHVIATYTVNVVAGFTNRLMRIGGTKALIDADLVAGTVTLRRRDPSGEEQVPVPTGQGSHGGADGQVFPNFAAFIRGQAPGHRYVAPPEAAVAVRIGLAATKSSDENAVVKMVC